MGQKIKFDPQDWDFSEESTLIPMQSEILLPHGFAFKEQGSERKEPQSNALQEGDFEYDELLDDEQLDASDESETEITAFLNGEKIQIGRHSTDNLSLSQEEEAFRRQIEDLFELLELEQSSHKVGSIRVYQTDSSPSRPWRFH
jgi:hypothetical protein